MAAPLVQKMNVFKLGKLLFSNRCMANNSHFKQQKRNFGGRELLKRFYKLATITQDGGEFEINLDKRKLKTPGGNVFRVPNEALALAVATEWNMQDKLIKRYNMHLTKLCNTAIDKPVRKSREDYIRHIIYFLETDTISYRSEEPEGLLSMQQRDWDPVVKWIEERYSIEVPIYMDITSGIDLPQVTVDTLTKHLESQNDWALIGYSEAADMLKSLVLCLAVMDKHISVEKCINLARLETNFQVERWGNVEWHHDLDIYDLQARLAATVLFAHWSNERHSVKSKENFLSSLSQT